MPKTRFSVVDCARMASEVNALLSGSWVQNIYTTEEDNKTFLFKLTGRGDKYLLLLESGVRFHPTEFVRDKSDMPSGFAMKLRKHVRGRRLEYCRQVGLDRVVDFAFGKGTQHHHVVLEMYAGGNVILTNEEGVILTLLRPYTSEEAEGARVAVGQRYPFDLALEGPRALLLNPGANVVGAAQVSAFVGDFLAAQQQQLLQLEQAAEQEDKAAQQQHPGAGAKKKGPSTVKQDKIAPAPPAAKKKHKKKGVAQDKQDWIYVLSSKGSPYQSFGPQLVEHCLVERQFDANRAIESDAAVCAEVAAAMELAPQTLALLQREDVQLSGYVQYEKPKPGSSTAGGFYEGFEPLLFKTYAKDDEDEEGGVASKEFPSFHQAVDDYFSKTEQQRQEKQRQAADKANASKIDNVRRQQEERVQQLQQAVQLREQQARALQRHVDLVDQAMGAVQSLLESKMSWKDVEDVVRQEKRSGRNPVAAIIAQLNLKEGKITVALPREDDDEEEEDEDEEEEGAATKTPSKPILVEVELAHSAQANVALMFSDKKRANVKAEVTQAKAALVVEDMQNKLHLAAVKKQERAQPGQIRQQRKPFWFEKFHWFLTSEGVLVLGGRDAHQNEQLFKRFLRKGDAYLHADFHGATTCIVRNPFAGQASAQSIPLDSMRQAGVFCICHSQAWQAKLITSAWWVEAGQVSRTAPSGEYLSTGSFMIRGKKNYLQPPKLEMAFGYIFKLDLTVAEDEEDGEGGEDGEEGQDARRKEWRYLKGLVPAPVSNESSGGGGRNVDDDDDGRHEIVTTGGSSGGGSKPRAPKQHQQQQQPVHVRPSTAAGAAEGAAAASSANKEPSRRAKLKMKRAATKYAGQTEEEKRLAMRALGHKVDSSSEDEDEEEEDNGGEDDEDKEAAAAEEEEEDQEQQPTSWLVKNKVHYQPTSSSSSSAGGAAAGGAAGGAAGAPAAAEEEDEPTTAASTGEDEGPNIAFKGFTASPQPNDVLLYALPFCAPVEAMVHFKFKVKLTPGTLKKGKAAKQAVALFAANKQATSREKQVISAVTDPENVAMMMMDVKVSAPGIEKLRAVVKSSKKKAATAAAKSSSSTKVDDNNTAA